MSIEKKTSNVSIVTPETTPRSEAAVETGAEAPSTSAPSRRSQRDNRRADVEDGEIELAVKVELVVENCPLREAFYDLRSGVPLNQHVASLFRRFFPDGGALSGRDPNDYAIWAPHGQFLTDEEWEQGLPQKQCWVVEGCTLQFKSSPAAATNSTLQRLRSGEDGAVKQAVFELKTSMMEMHFAEVFIEQGGIGALLSIATESARPAAQTYALQALRTALCWEFGVQRLLRLQGAAKLVRLVYSEHLKAVSVALELLATLCAREDGFKIVHGAALSVGRERGEQSYRRLCSLVGECDDLDVKTSALLLINQLVRSAPDKKARRHPTPHSPLAPQRARRVRTRACLPPALPPPPPRAAHSPPPPASRLPWRCVRAGQGASAAQADPPPRARSAALLPASPAGGRLPPAARRVRDRLRRADPRQLGGGRPLPCQVRADGARAAQAAQRPAAVRRRADAGSFATPRARVRACVFARVRACLRACVRACVRACLRACLRACVLDRCLPPRASRASAVLAWAGTSSRSRWYA